MKSSHFLFIVFLVILCPHQSLGGVDKNSIFYSARHPASALDLMLHKMEKNWAYRFILSPTPETQEKYPLIVKSKLSIGLNYSYMDEHISVTGIVHDQDGFVSLSPDDRKSMVKQTVGLVVDQLYFAGERVVDKVTGLLPNGKIITSKYLHVTIIFGKRMQNEEGRYFTLSPSPYYENGLAWFANGKYTFSIPYFVNLKIVNGKAVSGDPDLFVVEHEE